MAGIQISGLLANQAFDWKSVVDQLIAVSKIPVTNLEKEKATNTEKVAALAEINTAFEALQDSLQTIRADSIFKSRAVTSDNAATTWKSSSASGAPVGSYTLAVGQLATASKVTGASDIGATLAASNDVTGVTLSTMRTSAAVTAGYFSVNGQRVTIALTDSLQDVFDKISTATGGSVTASYDQATDKVTLTDSNPTPGAQLLLGASNDTSNFLTVMKLGNSGSLTTASTATLGTLAKAAPLNTAGLNTAITGLDGDGNGAFTINGVSIAYNPATDSLAALMNRINESAAGVTASYDSAADKVTLKNKSTGDVGITLADTTGNLLGALGLTSAAGGVFNRGDNAEFTINGGATIVSRSNTFDETAHGIAGLSVTVNTETTQTLTVESDAGAMQSAIENFIARFNDVQDLIEARTKVTIGGGNVSTSVLSSNREVQDWAADLHQMAFNVVSGVTGSIKRLDDLGIDFDGVTGRLKIKDQGKLSTALTDQPEEVEKYFMSGSSGQIPQMYGALSSLMSANRGQQSSLGASSLKIDEQITTLLSRIETERETLTNAFIRMLNAQSEAQSQNTAITNAFFKNNND